MENLPCWEKGFNAIRGIDSDCNTKAVSLNDNMRRKLWKEYFWSQSFCLLITGGVPIEVIKQYIESQGEKH